MRVRQIGTLVMDASTNIVVDAGALEAPGIGFRARGLTSPQPFSVELAFVRSTRTQALNAVNALAREIYSYAQRRAAPWLAVAGGVQVVIEDAAGNATLSSYLRDGSVTLLALEHTTNGVIARVRIAGTLVGPFLDYAITQNILSTLLPYERRTVSLAGLGDDLLYAHSIFVTYANASSLYNALLVIEECETSSSQSRIAVVNPSSATGGITLQNWNAGWMTATRANFTSTNNGTITYTIPAGFLPFDAFRIFFEIFCPSTPPSGMNYTLTFDGQPQIVETVIGSRAWYSPTLYARGVTGATVTLQLVNAPANTLVMPLVFAPIDGVYVYNVVTTPPLTNFHVLFPPAAPNPVFFETNNGTVYGMPHIITSRHISVFAGMMVPTLTNVSADVVVRSRRIEPAAFA